MHIQIVILCVGYVISCARASVQMKVSSTWGRNGQLKTSAFCTFNITEKQRKGAWEMTIHTNIPTKDIKVRFNKKNLVEIYEEGYSVS